MNFFPRFSTPECCPLLKAQHNQHPKFSYGTADCTCDRQPSGHRCPDYSYNNPNSGSAATAGRRQGPSVFSPPESSQKWNGRQCGRFTNGCGHPRRDFNCPGQTGCCQPGSWPHKDRSAGGRTAAGAARTGRIAGIAASATADYYGTAVATDGNCWICRGWETWH